MLNLIKTISRRSMVQMVGRVAPLTWRWRKPGSLLVMMYHRVLPRDSATRELEQPGMYVSPETLDLHLTELGSRFELVHLDDWLRREREGRSLPRLACAITFDDGWRDNFDHAQPVLVKHSAPATIFLVSSFVGTMQRFWPNRLTSLLYASFTKSCVVEFPERLSRIVAPILTEAQKRGRICADDIDRAVQRAKRMDDVQIRTLVDQAEKSCTNLPQPREILASEEIAKLAATGLFRFGSHTATHFRLAGRIGAEELEVEIVDSQRKIRDLCGQEVSVFCYPNGEISAAAIALVRQNYLGAVTTVKGCHATGDDPYFVARIGVHDDISGTRQSLLARVSGLA